MQTRGLHGPGGSRNRGVSLLEGSAQVGYPGKTVKDNENQSPVCEHAGGAVGRGKDNYGGWGGGLAPDDGSYSRPF